jgi:hypothetical protein
MQAEVHDRPSCATIAVTAAAFAAACCVAFSRGAAGAAVLAEQYLGNAVLLTHDGYGHLYFQDPSTCVNKAMVDYLVDLITPPRGTVCASAHEPFDPAFG